MNHLRQNKQAWIAWMVGFLCSLVWLEGRLERRAYGEQRQVDGGRVDTTRLLEIEKRVLPPCIVPGPWSQENLPDYYWATNAQLKSRFQEARKNYEVKKRDQPYQALTLVAGVAGLGKTFIKGEVFSKNYPAHHTYKFDIKELYADWRGQGKTHNKPDLFCGQVVVSSLLSVSRPKDNLLLDRLVKQNAKFYVIDSLDEIHPDDYLWALKQIEQFVFRSNRDFVHVVVIGRPFAFCDYWCRDRTRHANRDSTLFMLSGPQFRTTGDLQISSWNYHCWRYKLSWKAADGHAPSQMPFHAYTEWTRLGFDRSGMFQTVSYEPNHNVIPKVHEELTKWAREQPVAASMIGNLAGNSILREIVSDYAAAGRVFKQRDVMKAYLDAWLVRDSKSDNRPSQAKPEHLDLYLRLLEGVAVKYLEEDKIDEQGFFSVQNDDTIEVTHDQSRLTFSVKRILNRSGLIYSDPRQQAGCLYRFEPIWFHRLLVDIHNDRQE